jgi:hypothetical protein
MSFETTTGAWRHGMPDGSTLPLSPEQEEFMERAVAVYRSGVHSSFIFWRSHGGSSINYEGATHLGWSPKIDDNDLEELSRAGLIGGKPIDADKYRGKPTAVAIARFAPSECPESGPGTVGNATAAASAAEEFPVSGAAESRDASGGAPRRRGFPANADNHYIVADVVSKIGADWPSRLEEVCRQLQKAGAVFPKSLKNQEDVDSWDEIAGDILGPANSSRRERVVKHIKYRINWVRRNQASQK